MKSECCFKVIKKAGVLLIVILAFCNFPASAQADFYTTDQIREVRMYFKEANWDHLLDSLFLQGADNRLLGDVRVEGHSFKNVGVRYKGFSSANVSYKKNPFNIELDYAIPHQNYQGFTKLKLSNVIHDPSFIREVLSYEIARKYMPAGRANFARVYVNDTLIGLFTNVEAVDKIFISKHFSTTNGSFFKGSPQELQYPFGQNANLAYTHGPDSSAYIPFYAIESDYGWKYLFQLIFTLSNDIGNIQNILNVDRALWMHAFNYTLLNLDSYIGYSQNYYIYRDHNGQFNTIPWDMNMSFGSFRKSDGSDHFMGLTIPEAKVLDPLQHMKFSITPRPLMAELFKDSTNKHKYLAHLRTILKENFISGTYIQRAAELQALINSAVQQDTNKFDSYNDFLTNLNSTTAPGTPNECPGISDLMEARITFLKNFLYSMHAPVISEIYFTPEHPARGEETRFKIHVSGHDSVYMYYRTNSSDVFKQIQMFDDGNHHDDLANDGYYGASMLSSGQTLQFYFYAEDDSTGQFSPERAEYEFYTIQPKLYPGELVINEFMADNRNTAKDPQGDYADWVELFNNTKENIRLFNLHMTDDPQQVFKWSFPDTIIPPKSYLSFWADNKTSFPGIHSNFTLLQSGGLLFLTDFSGKILDSVYYDKQITGISMGRSPNGAGPFTYMNPTYLRYNEFVYPVNEGLQAFPNPAHNYLFVEIKNDPGAYKLEVYNALGQKIYIEEFVTTDESADHILKEINIVNFNKGSYLVKVQTKNTERNCKFIVY
ncbi:MAG: CotH kinase family protein [Bacteroidota bacterium]